MEQKKAQLRTSEDVFKNLRFFQELDEDSEFFGEQDLWIGYQDGKYGPMEQLVSAFVPIKDGGDLPFTRIWYIRCGDRILWDRRRRLDELSNSGDTTIIHAVLHGEKVKGFDVAADRAAAHETEASIVQARTTMAEMEEERQILLAEQQKRRQRKQARMQKEKAERERKVLAEKPRVDARQVVVEVVGGAAASVPSHAELRILTWNALNDGHADEYPQGTQSWDRAAGLAKAICEQNPDLVAMQEATPAMIAAVDAVWPSGCWRNEALGELVVWSRHPITRAFAVKLGANTSKEALLVEVVVQRRAVAVACVHFTSDFHGDNSLKRAAQAKIVKAAFADRLPHADIFVCGDFNEPNADGVETAVLQMEGLMDAWVAVHGPDSPGCTFDPTRSRMAALGAVCKTPRRMDRIFAAPAWSVKSAALLGEGQEHSDHFGVLATFTRESSLGAQPVHTSAVVLIPPQQLWQQIDDIRKRFDKSYGRWMPHINLIYGFLPEEHFPEAAAAMESVVRKHGPIEIHLEQLSLFEHSNSASLVILPRYSPDGIGALQQELQGLFPACLEQSRHGTGFQSHLTLGKFEGDSWAEDARRWKAELSESWKPISFIASEVCLLARAGDQPFGVRHRLLLGSALSRSDCAMLEALEAGSGRARAFAIGSAALLGELRPSDSDLDVLLVGTRERDAVFRDLESCMAATWTRRVEGKFPLLQLEVCGLKLDVQYSRSCSLEHPVHWPSASCADGGLAAAALRDICALRAFVLDAHGVEGWQLYQHALLKLKLWAKSRFIDSNALGYLGGFAWSLLLADTLLNDFSDAEAEKADDLLVLATCRRFAAWAWPTPVLLSLGIEPADVACGSAGLMPILCPTEPYANSARNITASTLAVIRREMESKVTGKKPIVGTDHHFVVCQVTAAEPAQASVVAHWLEARLLHLVRKLDHVDARPMCLDPLLYVVRASAHPIQLQQAVDEFLKILDRDDKNGWYDLVIVRVEDGDSVQRHCQELKALRRKALKGSSSTG